MIIIKNGEIVEFSSTNILDINKILDEDNIKLIKYLTKILNLKIFFDINNYSYFIELNVIFNSKLLKNILSCKFNYNPNTYNPVISKENYFNKILSQILHTFDIEILNKVRYGIILNKELPYKYLQSKIKEHEKI
jgi:hypothetical protein